MAKSMIFSVKRRSD